MTASSRWRSSSASACSASRRVSSSLRAFCSAICSGVGLPFSFAGATQVVDPPLRLAPAGVRLEQAVEVLAGAAARERRAVALGIAASGADVDHGAIVERAAAAQLSAHNRHRHVTKVPLLSHRGLWVDPSRAGGARWDGGYLPATDETYAATSWICCG